MHELNLQVLIGQEKISSRLLQVVWVVIPAHSKRAIFFSNDFITEWCYKYALVMVDLKKNHFKAHSTLPNLTHNITGYW
jgi:hypothetical protein